MARNILLALLLGSSAPVCAQGIVQGEYWIDVDHGFGLCTPIPGLPTDTDVTHNFLIPTDTLSLGMHTVGIRSKDASNRWSHTNHFPIYVADSSNGVITHIEYFWDIDPGFGLSPHDTLLADQLGQWEDTVLAYMPELPSGFHILFWRSVDSRGRWSHTNHDSVNVIIMTVAELLQEGEIDVYPNPFTESITVAPTDAPPLRVTLYDPQGKLAYDRVISGTTRINLSGLSNGAYTAFFWKDLERIHRVTLIKQ